MPESLVCEVCCVLQTLKETSKLGLNPIDQWPTYAATMRKIVREAEGEDDDCTVYQCHELKNFSDAVSFYSSKYACAVAECIKSRLSWSDMNFM